MKKILFLFALLPALIIAGCEDNNIEPYAGEDSVYFQLTDVWSEIPDSVSYSFFSKNLEEARYYLRVNLQGYPSDVDRCFSITVNTAESSATPNVHYLPLEDNYILPAGATIRYVPVTLLNTDERMKENIFDIVFELEPTDDLKPGLEGRLTARLVTTNMAVKPDYYDRALVSSFSTYSRIKHEKVVEVIGKDFPETYEEYVDDRNLWLIYGNVMSDYFRDNDVLDENGISIEPW